MRAHDIIDTNNLSGWRLDDIMAMMKHYGFVESSNGGSKHYRFEHRDYPDLTIGFKHGPHTEVPRAYVRDAAELCLEVKKRNEQSRNFKALDPVPPWIMHALPTGEAFDNDDKSVTVRTFTYDGEQPSATMNYRLEFRDGGKRREIVIKSEDLPDHERHLTLREGNRERAEVIRHAIHELDRDVRYDAETNYGEYQKLESKLVDECGFERAELDRDDVPSVQFTHPTLPIELFLPRPPRNHAVRPEALTAMRDAQQRVETAYIDQFDHLDLICQGKGWSYHHDRDHHQYVAGHEDGRSVAVPTYGKLGIFSAAEIERLMQQTEQASPITVVEKEGLVNGHALNGHGPAKPADDAGEEERPSLGPNTLRMKSAPPSQPIFPNK